MQFYHSSHFFLRNRSSRAIKRAIRRTTKIGWVKLFNLKIKNPTIKNEIKSPWARALKIKVKSDKEKTKKETKNS